MRIKMLRRPEFLLSYAILDDDNELNININFPRCDKAPTNHYCVH